MKARKLFAALATAMALVGFVSSIIPAQARDYDRQYYRQAKRGMKPDPLETVLVKAKMVSHTVTPFSL
jgi:hypothetical protein